MNYLTKQQVAKKIRELTYQKGQFLLSSGKKSDYYINKYALFTNPQMLSCVAKIFADYVCDNISFNVSCVCGLELGGAILATAVSLQLDLPLGIIRSSVKPHGPRKRIEGKIKYNDKVLLVEDVVTTGSQIIQATKYLNDYGCHNIMILALIDRLEGAAENIFNCGIRFDSILTIHDIQINEKN